MLRLGTRPRVARAERRSRERSAPVARGSDTIIEELASTRVLPVTRDRSLNLMASSGLYPQQLTVVVSRMRQANRAN